MQLNIDLVIFIGFLIITLIVGLLYGRNVKTIKDYALGGRNFSTAALVATIVATSVTGSGFFVDLSNTYSQGITYVIASLAMSLQFLMLGLFIAPRMGEFMGSLSVAEMMGNLYGNKVRLITAISDILSNVGFIAVQFKVFGSLVQYFVGVSQNTGIVIAAIIVIIYSAFGGIRAVTYTDVLQFFTFGFVIPMIGIIIWNKFQIMDLSLSAALQHPLFHYKKLSTLEGAELFNVIFLIIYFLIPSMPNVDFQRISMGRSVKQVRTAFMISLVLFVCISLAVMWIPFLIVNIEPGLDPNNITGHIIDNYAHVGLRGLIIIGIAAMAMSSADSFINCSAVLFAYDVKEVLNIKVDNLLLSKIFSFVLGIFAIYLAISTHNLLDLVMTTASFYLPVVTIPLLLSVFGFRSSAKSVLISMAAGALTVIIWNILDIEIEVVIPAMVINALFLFGSHYFLKQPGGWVGIKDHSYLDETRRERKRKINNFIGFFKFSKFIEFCKKTAPKDEMMYTWLGIYCIFFTLSTMYSTQTSLHGTNGPIILTIYQIMMCTGVVTAMYPIWPPRIKHEIIMQVAWNIIIFYMLIFFSCFFAMLSHFGQLQFAIFTINIIITALLVGWKLSLPMTATGFYLSTIFYKYYAGINQLNVSLGSSEFIFMYTMMLIGSALIIFLKPKQEQLALTEEKNKHLSSRIGTQEQQVLEALAIRGEFIRNITHEYNTPMTGITSLAQSLWQHCEKMSTKEIKGTAEYIFKSAKRLQNFDDNISSISKLSKDGHKLNLELISLSELVEERIRVCRRFYEDNNKHREFETSIEENIVITADKNYLAQAIDNLIINAITYCLNGRITVSLIKDEKSNKACFSITDEGIGIPKDELYDIFAEFVVSSKTRSLAGNRGIGLALCKPVIELHKGEIKAESNGVKGASFSFWLLTS